MYQEVDGSLGFVVNHFPFEFEKKEADSLTMDMVMFSIFTDFYTFTKNNKILQTINLIGQYLLHLVSPWLTNVMVKCGHLYVYTCMCSCDVLLILVFLFNKKT